MNAKPLRMADLPGRVYRCIDEVVPLKTEQRKDSYSYRLSTLEVGEQAEIPRTSNGIVSRMSRRHNIVLKVQKKDDEWTIVTRVK